MTDFLLVTDLDNTLVGDDEALAELNDYLSHHRQQFGTKIVYSTGRSQALYHQLTTEKTLLQPDFLILSVGTEIYLTHSDTPDPNWANALSQNWDRDLVVATAAHFADLTPQPDTEQRPFKVSYFLTETAAVEVLPQLEHLLQERGLDVQLIYSGSIDLDILPRRANKGMAMSFLRDYLEIAPDHTVACGDSGNDLSMFANRDERGIIVGNAMPELLHWHQLNPSPHRYLAKGHCAAGILEGLKYFGFL
ncbi:MAG: sucrose-phosphate phosphatase [Oscillatoriales cyanobacterium C42_A2020_001]|nr:sucrose-phosphate phosphatase [Leptolyngbyaceae cyanobacterium C42_A2020_001]